MKYIFILIVSLNFTFGQENQIEIETPSNNQKAGKLIEGAGNHLVKYVNSSIRNNGFIFLGSLLATWDYEDEADAVRNSLFGLGMIFVGTVGQITNIFKIKRAGEQLQTAGKKLKTSK